MMNTSSVSVSIPDAKNNANADAGAGEGHLSLPATSEQKQEEEEQEPQKEKVPSPPRPSPPTTSTLTKPKGAPQTTTTTTTSTPPTTTTAKLKIASNSSSSLPPTINDDGTVSFSLSNVHEHFICSLCSGYYKEPFTLHDCLHTFCKSCLYYSVACGCFECPSCGIFVGKEIHKFATRDNSLQGLIDAIFPDFVKNEEKEENEFYKKQGIKRKIVPNSNNSKRHQRSASSGSSATPKGDNNNNNNNNNNSNKAKDEIEFALYPSHISDNSTEDQLEALDKPFLRVSGRIKMTQLKRYVVESLGLPSNEKLLLDILCNGVPVGDEISLSFVKRLLWPHHESILELTYKRNN